MADILNLDDDKKPNPLDVVAPQGLEETVSTQGFDAMSMPMGGAEVLAADNIPEQLLRQRIVEALCTVYDPEIPVNIYELGLIYALNIDDENNVILDMTLTSPACPVAGTLPGEVQAKVESVPGVAQVHVNLVWDPPYGMERMSEAARFQLGFF